MKPTVQRENEEPDVLVMVSDLIDTENWSWNSALVRRNFVVPEADAILNIPLRRGGGEDFLAWNLEKTGTYSVKSAYHSLMTRNELSTLAEGMVTETSNSENRCGISYGSYRWLLKCEYFGGVYYVVYYQ
jgi:hypothetical protein